MNTLLSPKEQQALVKALVDGRLTENPGTRGVLMQFISPQFVALLPSGLVATAQLMSDVAWLARAVRWDDGEVPLLSFLGNAVMLLGASPDAQRQVQALMQLVERRASGAPAVDLGAVSERQERLIHRDDTVDLAFMAAGCRVAASVAKLRVHRHEAGQAILTNGRPFIYLGTGWLVAPGVLMTNHHVLQARGAGEPPASAADMQAQAAATTAEFDHDAEDAAGTQVPVTALLAWDEGLDYALLACEGLGRAPLTCLDQPVQRGPEPQALNIVQHPGGRAKRYGIRNNLLSAADAHSLRYFTDTEPGSSGSPVLNDRWQVVGLHCASEFVEGVSFQGKPTAYVNVGTQISAVLAHLRQHWPEVAARLPS